MNRGLCAQIVTEMLDRLLDDEPTTVTVTVATAIQAGDDIPQIPTGESRSFVLNRFDEGAGVRPDGPAGRRPGSC